MNLYRYWLFLAGAIILEVAGTSIMKASQSDWAFGGMLTMYAMLGLSYYLLARAAEGLPIGVAYAFWEGFGLVLIVLVSCLLLGEAMTPLRLFGLGLVLGGSLLVHRGTQSHEAKEDA